MDIILDDSMAMKTLYSEVCSKCKYLKDGINRKCKAFKEIPSVIWEGENDHIKPYPGDNGIQFERAEQK